MGARSLARLAAPLALAAAGCGPAAPASFAAESTMAFHVVRLSWRGPCDHRCDVEARSGTQVLGVASVPAGAEDLRFELPPSVGEMTSILFRLRNVEDDGDASDWVEASYLAGISSPGLWLLSSQSGSFEREIELVWDHQSPLATGVRVERFVSSIFDDPASPESWEEIPIPPGAVSYRETRVEEWTDLAIFAYRVRSLAGAVESHPLNVASYPGPPAAPSDLTATVEGSTVRLSWTNRSRVATSVSVTASDEARPGWPTVASLPPQATYHVETGLSPGFHLYGVEAVWEEEEIFGSSGPVWVGALLPDPALEPAFEQGTVVLPYADAAARTPGGEWALGSYIGWAWRGAFLWAPEGSSWAVFETPNRYLAHPGPLVDAGGRVHAFLGPGPAAPELTSGPIVHVWREGGAWHEEQVGDAVSLLYGQIWAAAAPDGSLHVLWRSEPGVPVASYATNRGGSWTVEQVPSSALADEDVGVPLAVTPSGEAAVLLPAQPGGASSFTLHRRAGGTWTAEPIPDEPAPIAPTTLALLVPSGERALWVESCGPRTSGLGDVCLRERTAAGWGASTPLAQGVEVYVGAAAALSADGTRAALAVASAPAQLSLVEEGATRSWWLPAAGGRTAVGFDGGGKAWVLSGLTGGEPGWGTSTYTLFRER